jgi:hypothetical protein
VVLSGDAISGYWGSPTKEQFRNTWKRLIGPMAELHIPWAFINGNHDSEGPLNRRDVVDLDASLGGLSRNGPPHLPGSSNYVLPIYNNDKIETNLFFFDSMSTGCHGKHGWGCVPIPVVEWYQKISTEMILQQNRTIPGLSFVHIPLQELMALWNYAPTYGVKGEKSGCSASNSGLLRAFTTQGDVFGVFSGHDHKNDYWSMFNKIRLAYGRKSGYGGYDSNLQPGARVIELTLDPWKMKTWIRQADGTKAKKRPHFQDLDDVQLECDIPEPESDSIGWLPMLFIILFCLLLIGVAVYFHRSKSKTIMNGRKFV